ncbi:hypothetical protein AB4Z22_45685, partial [Paenibacillus sp. TAF58]
WTEALAETRRVTDGRPDQRELALADYEEAELHRLRGEDADAERSYEAASRRGLDPQPGLALLRLAQGDVATAVGAIRRATSTTVSPLGRARYLPALVEILLAAEPPGDLGEAQAAAAELGEIATTFGT